MAGEIEILTIEVGSTITKVNGFNLLSEERFGIFPSGLLHRHGHGCRSPGIASRSKGHRRFKDWMAKTGGGRYVIILYACLR